jgi:hypothetical protein
MGADRSMTPSEPLRASTGPSTMRTTRCSIAIGNGRTYFEAPPHAPRPDAGRTRKQDGRDMEYGGAVGDRTTEGAQDRGGAPGLHRKGGAPEGRKETKKMRGKRE